MVLKSNPLLTYLNMVIAQMVLGRSNSGSNPLAISYHSFKGEITCFGSYYKHPESFLGLFGSQRHRKGWILMQGIIQGSAIGAQ